MKFVDRLKGCYRNIHEKKNDNFIISTIENSFENVKTHSIIFYKKTNI